jgi:hypothetical protein
MSRFIEPASPRRADERLEEEAVLAAVYPSVQIESEIHEGDDARVGVRGSFIVQFFQPRFKQFRPSARLRLSEELDRISSRSDEPAPQPREEFSKRPLRYRSVE